jgi:opacity protein-like surface antigen
MFYRFATLSVLATCFTLLIPDRAQAQLPAAQHSVTGGVGVFNFDLSGTGNAAAVSGRGTVALTRSVAVEGNLLFAWPEQQFGPSSVTAIDAHLQYHWRVLGRLRPFAGGGIGFLTSRSDFGDWTQFTLSAAGGARFDVTDRLSILGEFRLRGVETDFVGSTAEVLGGLTYRVGAF